ncbi:MAG: helix-turn-helix domain-containing protein [Micrococcus sp.]|nr:helix-turn-helix domain-containing protein [Micrococcus sp.]
MKTTVRNNSSDDAPPRSPQDGASETSNDIGATLKAARLRYRLTQQQLADLAGLSDRTVRDIEKGSTSPSLAAVLAVAETLGVRIEAVV